jgi:hypothetical protein
MVKDKIKPFAVDPLAGKPQEIVEQWLKQLQLRGIANIDPPFLEKGTRDALMDAINANQDKFRKIGLDAYVVAAPERASSRQIRELIKLIPKDRPKEKAKLQGLIAASDRHNTMMEWLLGIHQMADMNPHIEGLQQYVSGTRAMENAAISWSTMADGRLRQVQKLGKEQANAVFDLMYDLDGMIYLSEQVVPVKADPLEYLTFSPDGKNDPVKIDNFLTKLTNEQPWQSGGLTFKGIRVSPSTVVVVSQETRQDGEPVARFTVRAHPQKADAVNIEESFVDRKQQRRGAGSGVYDKIASVAQVNKLSLLPTGKDSLTKDGIAFWSDRLKNEAKFKKPFVKEDMPRRPPFASWAMAGDDSRCAGRA